MYKRRNERQGDGVRRRWRGMDPYLKRAHPHRTRLQLAGALTLALFLSVLAWYFVGLQREARSTAFQGTRGAFTSAVTLVHLKWISEGGPAGGQIPLAYGQVVEVNAAGWPTVDPRWSDQDSAHELYGLLLQSRLPQGWSMTETPARGAGAASYTLRGPGGGTFLYDGATGTVE